MAIRLTILLILSSIAVNCVAQQSKIDSLESLVKSVPIDTNKVWLLNRLVDALRERDNKKAITFAEEARALSQLLKYERGLSHALENLGWILYRKGDYSKSLEVSAEALSVSTKINDVHAVTRCRINIAAIYYEQKLFHEAIVNFKEAYKTASSIGDTLLMARSLNNIAYAFYNEANIDSAFHYSKLGFSLSQHAKDPYMIAFGLRTLGDIQFAKNNYKESLTSYEKALALSIRYDNTFIKASVLHRLAKTFARMGEYDKAIEYLTENVEIARKYGFQDELERTYKMFSEIYQKKNDLAKAFAYQSAYLKIHDSLYTQRSSEQIALMQARFDTALKQKQIELLTKDAALQKEVIEKQRLWIYFYVGCVILLLILAFVLYYYYRYNWRAKVALEHQNKAIETQSNQLRNLNATKDKLFSIISHDLRSPVASLRAVMELVTRSELSQAEFKDLTFALKRNIDSVYEDLDNLLMWAQSQLKGLQAFPESFDIGFLADEKAKLFDDLARNKGIKIINNIPHGIFVSADRNHVSLIFRNLITNAVKFSRPEGIISLTAGDRSDKLEITVTDSGVGISVEDLNKLFNAETHFTKPGTQKEKGVGIGLLITKEFVETNEGSICVESTIGVGTSFTFSLPLSRQEIFV